LLLELTAIFRIVKVEIGGRRYSVSTGPQAGIYSSIAGF